MPDYNKFIEWAQQKSGARAVKIETNGKQISVWVSQDNEDGSCFSGFVQSVEEIDELEARKRRRELAEYERLKAKFETPKGETNLCDTCQYKYPNCPAGDTHGYDADGNPVDDNACGSYRPW